MGAHNSSERQVAQRLGFTRPRPRLRPLPVAPSVHPGTSLPDRLGLRSGMRVTIVGPLDDTLRGTIAACAGRVGHFLGGEPCDMLFFQAESSFSLRRVRELVAATGDAGSLWILWPHDQQQIKQGHVQRAATGAGLTVARLTRVSEKLTGAMLVRSGRA